VNRFAVRFWSGGGSTARSHYHDWYLPLGPPLIIIVGRIHLREQWPESSLFLFCRLHSRHAPLHAPYLNLHAGVTLQVGPPRRSPITSAVRRYYRKIGVIREIEQRSRSLLPGLAPGRRQEENGRASKASANAAACQPVEEYVQRSKWVQ